MGKIKLPRTAHCICGQGDDLCICIGIVFHLAHALQALYTVHIRHLMVQKNDVILFFHDHIQALDSAVSSIYLNSRLFQKTFADFKIHTGIIHNEDLCIRSLKALLIMCRILSRSLKQRLVIADRRLIHDLLHQSKEKGTAPSVFAVHQQLGIHQLQQLLGKSQSKTCSLDPPVCLLIHTLEGGKQLFLILFFNTDTGIHNRHIQAYFIGFRQLCAAHLQRHRSLSRILHRIGQKIRDDLSDTHFITVELTGDLIINIQLQFQFFFRRPGLDHIDEIIQQ